MVFSSRSNKAVFWFLVFFGALAGTLAADVQSNILPLRDIKPGMKGIGKTVIQGRDIETFTVEVLGVLSNNKINENLLINGKSILVRVSGKVISEAGGIAAGMSGSPIYVNGKIIGGLSSGWVMTDHTVGMVTPIEEMLEIWEYPLMSCLPESGQPRPWISEEGIALGGKVYHRFWEVGCADEAALAQVSADEPVFQHAAAPVIIQGLCDRAASLLGARLKLKNVQTPPSTTGGVLSTPMVATSTGPASPANITAAPVLEPGSAIGVQLARGDINLTTLGTLTYRDGKKILGFAHPFLKKGNVAFLLTGAHIYHSFSSVQMPFKIGAPTEVVGTITQDREKGISGEIGRFPAMVPVQIDITDRDLKRSRSVNFQVVRDPTVLGTVLESTFVQSLEGVIDRSGEGTALMGIALECMSAGGAKHNFRRENLFHSRDDIIGTLVSEVAESLRIVNDSELEDIVPTRILLKIDLEKKRRTMTIEKVEVKNSSITPGGILEVWVTLRPYRDKRVVRKAKLPIPESITKDDLRLTVFGLASRNADTSQADAGLGTAEREPRKKGDTRLEESVHETFESQMREWVNSPQNSDLLFQLSHVSDEEKKIKFNGRDFDVQPTNLVVLGSVDTTITLSED